MAHQIKVEENKKNLHQKEGYQSSTKKMTDVHEWSSEQMGTNMGAKRAQSLRESGKLPKPTACPFTGSTEDHMVIWLVPVNWSRMTEEDWNSLNIEGEGNPVNAEELQNIRSSMASSSDGPVSDLFKVKTEPISEEEKAAKELQELDERIAKFVANRVPILKKFQDYELSAKTWQANVKEQEKSEDPEEKETYEYSEEFRTSLEGHVKAAKALTATLLRISTAKIKDTKDVPKILKQLDRAEATHLKLERWAGKYGYTQAKPAKKKARTVRSDH